MLGRAEGKAQSTLEALESAVAARGEAVEQCERMEADLTVCRAKRAELEKERESHESELHAALLRATGALF